MSLVITMDHLDYSDLGKVYTVLHPTAKVKLIWKKDPLDATNKRNENNRRDLTESIRLQ